MKGRTVARVGVSLCALVAGLVGVPWRSAQGTDSWVELASLPTGRVSFAAVADAGGHIYAIGGASNLFGQTGVTEVYSISTGTWSRVADMPTPRQALGATLATDGLIYAIGGQNGSGTEYSVVEAYDPDTDSWSSLSDMPTPRAGLSVVTGIEGRIYAMGGLDFTNAAVTTVEVFSPDSNSWSTAASMPSPSHAYAAAAVDLDGRIYVLGGVSHGNGPVQNPYVDVYDPKTNTWARVSSLPTPRHNLAGTTDRRGLIWTIAGNACEGPTPPECITSAVQVYNPSANSWSKMAPLPVGHLSHAAATGADGQVYVMGGWPATGCCDFDDVYAFRTPVGGVAQLPEVAGRPLAAGEGSDRSASVLPGIVIAAGALMLGGGAWYVRRRRTAQ